LALHPPIIRQAVQSDAASITRVHVDSWRSTYRDIVSEAHLAKLSYEEREYIWSRALGDSKQFTFVAEEAGRIVGFANGGRNRDDKSEFAGELYAVYLLQAYQQQGVGRRLTLAIAKELERMGMRSMMLWVLRDNPACAFYKKLGGKAVASNTTIIGGATLEEVAFGWKDMSVLTNHT
jgi:ribosomal protein S18 acetylase RimI-like enzyme